MPGITRINIKSDWNRSNDWRLEMSTDHIEVMNNVYRSIFNLADGNEIINITKHEALARYDWKEGIDLILTTKSNTRMTNQEKILTFHTSTITFEEEKTSGSPGAWYYCTAQYYSVAYNRRYWDYQKREVIMPKCVELHDYIVVDLAALHREDERGVIDWQFRENVFDGRKAVFRYIPFNSIPDICVIARHTEKQLRLF